MKRILPFFMVVFAAILIFSCSSDDDHAPDDPTNTTEVRQLITSLVHVIQESGLDFPDPEHAGKGNPNRPADFELPAEKYVSVDNTDPEVTYLSLWLDAEKHMVPTPEWQQENQTICASEGKFMRSPRVKIVFTIYEMDPYFTGIQLAYIDVETSRIRHSYFEETDTPGPNWIQELMTIAWDQLKSDTTIKDAVEPCEEARDLILNFHAVTTFSDEGYTYEEVGGEIILRYDPDVGGYVGEKQLDYIEGYSIDEDGNREPLLPPANRVFKVTKMLTPLLLMDEVEFPWMEATLPGLDSTGNMLIVTIVYAMIDVAIGGSTDEWELLFEDWTIPEGENIMEMKIDKSFSDEGTLITQESTLKVRYK